MTSLLSYAQATRPSSQKLRFRNYFDYTSDEDSEFGCHGDEVNDGAKEMDLEDEAKDEVVMEDVDIKDKMTHDDEKQTEEIQQSLDEITGKENEESKEDGEEEKEEAEDADKIEEKKQVEDKPNQQGNTEGKSSSLSQVVLLGSGTGEMQRCTQQKDSIYPLDRRSLNQCLVVSSQMPKNALLLWLFSTFWIKNYLHGEFSFGDSKIIFYKDFLN